jgi:hypothetical protein
LSLKKVFSVSHQNGDKGRIERSNLPELTIGRITVVQFGGLLQRNIFGHKLGVDSFQVPHAVGVRALHSIFELPNPGKLLAVDLVGDDPVGGRTSRAERRATRSGKMASLIQISASVKMGGGTRLTARRFPTSAMKSCCDADALNCFATSCEETLVSDMQQENYCDTHARGPFNIEDNTIRSLVDPAADSEHTIVEANLVNIKDRARARL